MDVVELREQLVHSNVSFATEITDLQEGITKALTDLTDIIAEIRGFQLKPSDYVNVSLIPPVVLILQLLEMTLSSVGNISGVFQSLQLPFDPYFFLQKYVPYVDWNEFKNEALKIGLERRTATDIRTASGAPPEQEGGFQ